MSIIDELFIFLDKNENHIFRFNNTYKLQYITDGSYNSIIGFLSKSRCLKEINTYEYNKMKATYDHLLKNNYKIKTLISKEPRTEAQKFIGRKKIRNFIFNRDKKCLKCGSENNLCIDHIYPINKGGLNKLENLQTLCKSCNSSKRDNYFDYRKNINK